VCNKGLGELAVSLRESGVGFEPTAKGKVRKDAWMGTETCHGGKTVNRGTKQRDEKIKAGLAAEW